MEWSNAKKFVIVLLVLLNVLLAELPSYNKETLERLFFGSARTTASTKGGETVYQGKLSSLTMSGAHGVWETKAVKSGKGEMTKTEALREAQKFIDNTEHFFGSYGDAIIAEESEKGRACRGSNH